MVDSSEGSSSNKLFAIVGLLLLIGAAAAAYFVLPDGPEAENEVVEEKPKQEKESLVPQFADGFDIPEEESEPEPEPETDEKKTTVRRAKQCSGTIDRKAASRAIATYRNEVQSCYESSLKSNQLLEGTLRLTLSIKSDGSVSRAVAGGMNDAKLRRCVQVRAKRWKFPAPDGGCATFAVPFALSPRQ